MAMIGLNVIETDGTATPAIAGAATSTAAFNIRTRRGVPGRPVLVTSFADFVQRFGDFDADALGAYLVKGFFDNGGRRAYVNRVVGAAAAAPATSGLLLRTGTGQNARDVLRLQAGFRGAGDPGAWADGIAVATVPSYSTTLRQGANLTGGTAVLQGLAGFSVGDRIVITDGTAAHNRTATVTAVDAAAGQLSWSPDVPAPGDFAAATTTVSTADFDLAVRASDDDDAPVLETWPRLTMARDGERYVVAVLNDPNRGSRYLVATDERAANQGGAEAPGAAASMVLDDGDDGDVGSADFIGTDA